MSEPVIRIRDLSKLYRVGTRAHQTGRLTETVSDAIGRVVRRNGRNRSEDRTATEFWALNDISLDVTEGEVLGVIGRNGAGKTTLLKILSRVTEPTRGYAELRGQVGALLEVGTGFHPELTGRENIFLNGGILGMSRVEIRTRFDEIVDFAGVERFIDTPVKRYSSGMFVRLAFAVAAHLEPDVLIIDEVLAVGDVAFQEKCLGKMQDVAKGGRTVLFVSHNMGAVKSLCTRCVTLEQGRVVCDSTPDEAIAAYLALMQGGASCRVVLPPRETEMWVEDSGGGDVDSIPLGEDGTLVVHYVLREARREVSLAALVMRDGTPLLYSYDTDADPSLRGLREAGSYVARVPLPTSLFKEGTYAIALKIGAGREDLTDDDAVVVVRVVNHDRDLTHRSYRNDRPGVLYRELEWETHEVEPVRR
jgi:lipopolysaccharide transport system ATP-binding protein